MKLTGKKRSTRRKICPSATLSTTNPTWTDPGTNPGLRGGRPAANRLSHGTSLDMKLLRIHFLLQMKANSRDIYIYFRERILLQWSYINCRCVHTFVKVKSAWWTVLCAAWVIRLRGNCSLGNTCYTILEVI
jgi:hypothetical protein